MEKAGSGHTYLKKTSYYMNLTLIYTPYPPLLFAIGNIIAYVYQ